LLAGLSVAPLPALADNLVSNPDFSQLITAWAHQPESAGSIAADFSHGSPGAPSAHVSGTEESSRGLMVSSCIEIDTTAHIDFVFNALVVVGSAVGSVFGYSDTACTEPLGLISTESRPPSAEWATVSLIDTALPTGTRSVAIAIRVDNIPDGPLAGTPGDAYFDHVAFGPTGTLPETIPINQQGLTGAWYEPVSRGQGFQFSIVPNVDVASGGTLFGAWYTYDTVAGGTYAQRWYSLEATLTDDARSADVTIYQNVGGTFVAPPNTAATPVGAGTLAFDSCTSGKFDYAFDDGRNGSIPLSALLPMTACSETGTSEVPSGFFGLSGAWYDPTIGGQGLMLSVDPFLNNAFAGWYTYAADADFGAGSGVSGQRWFSLQAGFGATPLLWLGIYESTGGVFDSDGVATTMQVGTATLTFLKCDHATLEYAFTEGELEGRSGTIDLARLGAPPTSCDLRP